MFNDINLQKAVMSVMLGKKEQPVDETVKHPNQQKIDVHEPEKDEITAKDFEMLRKGKKAKEVKEEQEVNFTVIGHNQFQINLTENTYDVYVKAARMVSENEDEAIKLADYSFNAQDLSIIAEMQAQEFIDSDYNQFINEGHEVSEPKYMVENNNVYVEYLVTDKESGITTNYITHGTLD